MQLMTYTLLINVGQNIAPSGSGKCGCDFGVDGAVEPPMASLAFQARMLWVLTVTYP